MSSFEAVLWPNELPIAAGPVIESVRDRLSAAPAAAVPYSRCELHQIRDCIACAVAKRQEAPLEPATAKQTQVQPAPAPNTTTPPQCSKHQEQMILGIYDRPGSSPGNGWMCRSCAAERASIAPAPAAEPVPEVVRRAQALADQIETSERLKKRITALELSLESARNELHESERARIEAQAALRRLVEDSEAVMS